MIIERRQWKIHHEVIDFWEKQDKTLHCYGQYSRYNDTISNGSATYFYEAGYPGTNIGADDPNVIARHTKYGSIEKMKYKLNGKWYMEREALAVIRMKAFL